MVQCNTRIRLLHLLYDIRKRKTIKHAFSMFYLTIGSCSVRVHYRVMEHAGSLESTKEA